MPRYSVDIESDDCPVNVLTPELVQIMSMDAMNRRTKEAAGACLFGVDSSVWPAWWADAVGVLDAEREREFNARMKASH